MKVWGDTSLSNALVAVSRFVDQGMGKYPISRVYMPWLGMRKSHVPRRGSFLGQVRVGPRLICLGQGRTDARGSKASGDEGKGPLPSYKKKYGNNPRPGRPEAGSKCLSHYRGRFPRIQKKLSSYKGRQRVFVTPASVVMTATRTVEAHHGVPDKE